MPAKTQMEDKTLIAHVIGEIDHHSARDIRETIDPAVERSKPERLVLDMSAVSFMDSSGIGLIMGRYRLISELGGELEISGVNPTVSRMISLAGLHKLNIKGVEKR